MSEIEKGWHNVYTLKYHIVWVTKYRYNKFFGQVEKEARQIFFGIAKEYDWEIEELGVESDHVHIYLSTELTDRPDDVVKWLKGESSKRLGRKYPYLKNKKGAVRARGYFISTVNDKTISEQIKRYIRNQKAVSSQGKLSNN